MNIIIILALLAAIHKSLYLSCRTALTLFQAAMGVMKLYGTATAANVFCATIEKDEDLLLRFRVA